MKVLLIAPYVNLNVDRTVNREDFYPSAALLHLAAMLRANNHEPIIVDLNNSTVHNQKEKYLDYCKKIIIESLNEFKPDLVGINCLFSGVFPDVLEFAKTVKSHSPNLKIAIGGIHPTSHYKEILANCKDVDFVAIGEGENTIIALTAAIESKNENMLSKIKSFAYRDKEGKVKFNLSKNYIENLDALPMPAWDLININKFEMKLDTYYNPKNLPMRFKAAIFSSRACPLACNFCDMFLVMGKKHRKRGVKTIVNEIELLNKDYGVNYFSFMDDQLTLNRSHILDLCNEILNRKLNIQFDTPNGLWINSLREEIIAKMAEAGLVSASLAIEHGDDHIRNKVIGKNLEKNKIFEVAKMLKKNNVMSSGLFIMGFPEDTNDTLSKTYEMMNELQLDRMAVNTLVPLPGTSLYKQVIKDNLLIHNWNLDELWKTPISLQQGEFVVKPYNLHLDDLYKWREKFNKIRHKYWKTNPKKSVGPHQASQHSKVNYIKKTSPLIYESVVQEPTTT
tara:strand:+ start:21446 stop:22966 length:1521 start_codon:yes stop_codon:yes gene_type:complete